MLWSLYAIVFCFADKRVLVVAMTVMAEKRCSSNVRNASRWQKENISVTGPQKVKAIESVNNLYCLLGYSSRQGRITHNDLNTSMFTARHIDGLEYTPTENQAKLSQFVWLRFTHLRFPYTWLYRFTNRRDIVSV